MTGFGFIEYEDALDARDVVPGMLLWLRLDSAYVKFAADCVEWPAFRTYRGAHV